MKIQYVIKHLVRSRDRNGNTYHAFQVHDTEDGDSFSFRHDCDSNFRYALGQCALEIEVVMAARDFDRLTRNWPYAFKCGGKELWTEVEQMWHDSAYAE